MDYNGAGVTLVFNQSCSGLAIDSNAGMTPSQCFVCSFVIAVVAPRMASVAQHLPCCNKLVKGLDMHQLEQL